MILYPKILYYTIITSFICYCIAHQYYEKSKKWNKKRCGSDVYNYVANKHTTDWNPRNWNKLMTVFKSLMYQILNTWNEKKETSQQKIIILSSNNFLMLYDNFLHYMMLQRI